MKPDLLTQLKKSTQRNWLENYDEQVDKSNLLIQNNSSQELYKLTQTRLKQIQSLTTKHQRKLKVVIVESHPIKFLATFLAAVIADIDLFLCDRHWQQQEWQQVLSLVSPDLVFADRVTKDLIIKTKASVNSLASQKYDLPEQSCIMIPTGGTSGKIRFTMHTWSTLTASVTGFQNYFGCHTINSCCILPLYHVSGLMQFMRSFSTQGNLIICPYKVIKTEPITLHKQEYFISLVPTQLQFLLKTIPEWLKQFKTVLLGGAPASRSLLELARRSQIPLAPTYGMTETASGVVTLKPNEFLAGNNSSGQILPHARVEIQSGTNSFPDNKTGLIRISSTSLCLGYYPRLLNQSQSLVTDDLGYLDENGYLYLVGRDSQKIITGGENVFPTEVEAAIWSTQLIRDVCVIGLPDRQWGQVVTAIYVPLNSEHDLDLIKQKIQLQLAKYKQPKKWIKVNSLPRNDRGKINYQLVKAIAVISPVKRDKP
ncbi:2-succinylbenzoate--CoA ligase [Pleurocapsa sp. PCC 7319]|uniref:2-succinylbenzoate--CoA ligase n=1 Tax=Pleurocapsa sp. PCC 7319 TaxID=118161 RepID=UPI000345B949|nr:2-succinylbenzoate--CoA ligase [Pleurocapsa sp. PCC 7319]